MTLSRPNPIHHNTKSRRSTHSHSLECVCTRTSCFLIARASDRLDCDIKNLRKYFNQFPSHTNERTVVFARSPHEWCARFSCFSCRADETSRVAHFAGAHMWTGSRSPAAIYIGAIRLTHRTQRAELSASDTQSTFHFLLFAELSRCGPFSRMSFRQGQGAPSSSLTTADCGSESTCLTRSRRRFGLSSFKRSKQARERGEGKGDSSGKERKGNNSPSPSMTQKEQARLGERKRQEGRGAGKAE
jgi:hypothetical protein